VTPTTGTSFTAYITAKYGGDKSYVSPVAYIYYLGSAALEVTSIQISTVSIYICIVVGSVPDPDPRVFWSPGSFYHHAKIIRKILNPTIL
jgi:hypothetical protein